jgi:hypothetical protein
MHMVKNSITRCCYPKYGNIMQDIYIHIAGRVVPTGYLFSDRCNAQLPQDSAIVGIDHAIDSEAYQFYR